MRILIWSGAKMLVPDQVQINSLLNDTLVYCTDARHYALPARLNEDIVLLGCLSRHSVSTEDINQNLIWSAQNGHLEVVQFLVRNGADIHANNDGAPTLSSQNGHFPHRRFPRSLP